MRYMDLVCLTIGTAFISAAIHVCLARIVIVYGEQYSRFRPWTHTVTFITCDLISVVLQAAGVAIADQAADVARCGRPYHGYWAFASSCRFGALRKSLLNLDGELGISEECSPSVEGAQFKYFLCCELPYLLLPTFIQNTNQLLSHLPRLWPFLFWSASVSVSLNLAVGLGALANDQITFMILEGAIIISGSTALAFFHPERAFDGSWAKADINSALASGWPEYYGRWWPGGI